MLKSYQTKQKSSRGVPPVSRAGRQHRECSRARRGRLLGCVASFFALFDFLNSLHALFLLNYMQLAFLSWLKNKDWSQGECHKHALSNPIRNHNGGQCWILVSSLQNLHPPWPLQGYWVDLLPWGSLLTLTPTPQSKGSSLCEDEYKIPGEKLSRILICQ